MEESKYQQVANTVINKTINMLPPGTRWMAIMMEIPWPKDQSKVFKVIIKVPETITTDQLDLIEGKIYEITPPEKFRTSKV